MPCLAAITTSFRKISRESLESFVAFFLSAILDNLTTTIVMISLMKNLLGRHCDRLFFAGIIVIAADAAAPGRRLAMSRNNSPRRHRR